MCVNIRYLQPVKKFCLFVPFQPIPIFMALQTAASLINWGLDAVQNIEHKAGQRFVCVQTHLASVLLQKSALFSYKI